jgi:myo-inositol catabolism protein IolC
MRAGRRLFRLVVVLGVFGATAAAALAASASWGVALEVPGSGALNLGGRAQLYSVSCATAGSCAAGGSYVDGSEVYQAFVVSKKNGVWGKAVEVPGSAALNLGGFAAVYSVSCAAAGSCAAGGYYHDGIGSGFGSEQAFVVSEKNGVWGKAVEVPGSAALNLGGLAEVYSVSCAVPGSCAAGGYYFDSSFRQQAFVVSEKNGVWGKAVEVPGSAALNLSGNALVSSVSCAAAGSCAAGGRYHDGSGHEQAFVVSEKNGVWGKAIEVPVSAALNLGGLAAVYEVSCAAAGSCAAGGYYADGPSHYQAFVVSEKKGVWGKAVEVPGSAALNLGGYALVYSVSCAVAGSCAAGGYYLDGSGHDQAFVVSEKNGVWGKAVEVPGSAVLNLGGQAEVYSVSCAAAGSCAAGGYYFDGLDQSQAFVVSEKKGVWGKGVEVPGSAALNVDGNAAVNSVSCAAAGSCAVGGSYLDGSGHYQVFVTKP